MKNDSYQSAIKYIDKLPRTGPKVFSGPDSLSRAKTLFSLLNNPQEQLSIIHIAGTSGKGTVAMITSAILAKHAQAVGMTLSPHVYDLRERIQINNEMISKNEFSRILNEIKPVINTMVLDNQPPSYFEVILAMAYYYFKEQKVNYAIIETGVGGLYDASNTVSRADKLAVITRIGFDHTQLLGKTLTSITKQKAGIVQRGNHVIALRQGASINKLITERARNKQATLEWISLPSKNRLYKLTPPENINLANTTARFLSRRDGWDLNESATKSVLNEILLPGRFERVEQNGKTFILDGAHNKQKLKALILMAKKNYPDEALGIIVAMKNSKTAPNLRGVKHVITTTYREDNQDMPTTPYNPSKLAREIKKSTPGAVVEAADKFSDALEIAQQSDVRIWLVSGSFLLLAEAKDTIMQTIF